MDRITSSHDASLASDSAAAAATRPTVSVVGFSGSVSEGAAAIKAPVFEIDGRFFSGDPESPPSMTYGPEQIEEFHQRGLLSLVAEKQPRIPGYVFLYAHESFLRPSEDSFDLMPFLGGLRQEKELRAYCDYMRRDRAMALLEEWAQYLLGDAQKALGEGIPLRSKESAMRARFGATREHPTLRERAHLYVAAARLALGESIYGVIRNVALESSEKEAAALRDRARGLVNRVHRWRTEEVSRLRKYQSARRFANLFADETVAEEAA